MSKLCFLSLLLGLLCITSLPGQILDDSTKEIYSWKTVRYRYENQMLSKRGGSRGDTTLENFSQKGDFIYQGDRIFQNLGVFGTAGQSLFFELPESIGLRNGFNCFDLLIPGFQQIRYFNSLSPYTEIQYTQGARQRSMLRATFGQNVLPGLNFTGHYQRFTALRTLNVTQNDERLADHHSAWVSGNYQSKNGHYQAWAHYQHANHLQYETGGGRLSSSGRSDSLFISPEIMPVWLNSNARNRELRNNWYATQVWKPFGNPLFIRTAHYRTRQLNRYTDPLPNLAFYKVSNLHFQKLGSTASKPDTLFSERVFQQWNHTLAVGWQDDFLEASLYVKNRNSSYRNNLLVLSPNRNEWIAGMQVHFPIAGGETEWVGEWINAQEWDVRTKWHRQDKWQFSLRYMRYRPSLIQSEFVSKNLFYVQDFRSTTALEVALAYKLKMGNWSLMPSITQHVVDKGIAFDASFLPFQISETVLMQRFGLIFSGKAGRYGTENWFYRVNQSKDKIFSMPGYVYHSAHWVDLLKPRKGFAAQLGFNLDWRYDWTSMIFHPLSGQWVLQHESTIPPYFLMDMFAHIRVDRARFYFKVHNTLQGLGGLGYFAAPNYPAQRRLFEIGVVWTFFD